MSDEIGTASIGLAVDSSGVDAGLNRMETTVTRATRSLSTLGQRGAAAVGDIATGATNSASAVERATQRQARSIQTLTAEIQAGGRATREFQETIARNRGGDAAVAQLRPYLDQLEHVRTAQQEAAQAALRGGQAFNTQSQSAAQLAANLRVVPAQLTDIVTSLQGGQQPLTVFLQQGGQLRDMFGSAGGAARALGGYLVSLISPLTVGAAAVALLAVAYNQGSKEADAFRKSIILTGNAAGVTTSQLAGMAKQASDVAGTQGANAEALAQLVGTGKVAADQLLAASITAVQSQKYLGIAVEDTVKAFADLGKDPLQATLKLNEQYNYLTLATYKQIKALTDQARITDAAKVAQTAFADSQASKNKQVADSLGNLQKSWNFVGKEAKDAWNFMLNIGRESTIDDQIKKAEAALKAAQFNRYSSIGTQSERDADRDEKQIAVDRLQNIKKVGDLTAQYAAEDTKSRDAAIKFDQQGEQYLTRRQKLEKEIVAARNLGAEATQRGEDPVEAEKRIQDRIAQIKQSYAALENEGIESRIAAVQRLGDIQEEQAKRALIVIQGGQEAGQNKALDQQAAYIKAISDADEKALVSEKSRIQQRLTLTAQEVTTEDGRAAQQIKLADLRGQIAVKDEQIANRRAERDKDLFVLDVKNNHDIAESYNTLFDARQADLNALDQQLQAQKDQNATIGLSVKQLEAFNTGLVEERATRLEGNAAILDTILGLEDEADKLRKTAERMRELNTAQIEGARKAADFKAYSEFWDSIDKSAQEAFSHIGEGGKSMLDRLRDSLKSGLLDLLYQLTVKQFIINVKANISSDGFGAIAGTLSGGSGGGTSGASLFGTATNLYSVGKSIYNGFSSGFAATLGSSVSTLGNLFGSTALSSFGAGMGLTAAQAGEAAAAYTSAAAAATAAGDTAAAGAYTAAAGGLSGGASAAAAVPIIGWIIAGMAAADGFRKQGFDPNNGTTNKLGIVSGLPAVASNKLLVSLGVGDALANILSGASINTKLFGRANPVLKDQALTGTINSSGIDATSSATIFEKGGWFRSDKNTPIASALDATTDAAFDKTIQAMIGAVKGFGGAIGEQTGKIDSYTKSFKLALTGDAAKDNEAVKQLFTDVGNELSTILVPSISKLSKEGESAADALQRLAGDYVTIDATLGAIGLTFKSVGVGSLDARESLIALSGGLSNFVSQAQFFSDNYLSESERIAAVTKQLDASFADLGVKSIPKTRDEFANLVKGLDLTTDGGQKTFAGLMNLEQAFALVAPQIDTVAVAAQAAADALAKQKEQRTLDIQLMEAAGNAEGALAASRKDALAALLTDQARVTQAQIYAAEDAKKVYDSLASVGDGALARLSASINAEKERINASYTTQAQAIRDATTASVKSAQDSLKAAQDQSSAIHSVFSALDSALGSTKIESDAASIARRQAAQAVLASAVANPGNLSNNKALTEALATITGQGNERLFGTFEEYARDQARTNNAIAALKDAAGEQADSADQTVKKLGDTIDAIQAASDKQLKKLEEDNQAQLDKLDEQLASASQQLDALKGINSAVLSVKDALALVIASLGALGSNPTGNQNATKTYTEQVNDIYKSVFGRDGDQAGLAFWVGAVKAGGTLDEVREQFLKSLEYQNLHPAPVKSNDTGYIDQSMAVGQVSALMARVSDPAGNSTALLEEVRRLNELTAAQQVTLDAIAEATGIAGDVLDKAQKGQPLATTTEGQ